MLLLFLGVAALPAAAVTFTPPFDPNADAVYLVNLDTGTVVYQKRRQKACAGQPDQVDDGAAADGKCAGP